MDNSFRQDDSNVQQPVRFFIRLPIVTNLFKWLAKQLEPTEEEQEDAGVYLGGEGRDGRNSQES